MIEKLLTIPWRVVADGVGNHLWQSTLTAVIAALLTLTLQKHHARDRYYLWLAASLKFLVPFSLLAGIGSRLGWLRSPVAAKPAVYVVIEELSQPFAHASAPAISQAVSSLASHAWPPVLLALAGLWLCGFLFVFFRWAVRWRRISAAIRDSVSVSDGREVGALRRAERIGGVRKPIELLLSRTSLEPGIFGIAHPVLIWPEGISSHLEDEHLDAIVVHEVWHVRRRDNLFAAVHMVVEAAFWFYPLVWWLGARLVEERERACDEEVVELGSNRHVYAESILKVCEFCLGSPLPCVSGVTGADLKKRMVHIMTGRMSHKLDFARKALLTLAAVLAIALPVTFGLLKATPSQAQSQVENSNLPANVFSSVSIKPSAVPANGLQKVMFNLTDERFIAQGATLQQLIRMAYRVQDAQISGGLDLLSKSNFDIDAKMDPSFVAAMKQQNSEHKSFDDQLMLKSLLASQFKVTAHFETRNLPAYDLVVDAGGSKLQEVDGIRIMRLEPGGLISQGTPIDLLTVQLSQRLHRPIVDKTGLKGSYAFNLHWTPDPGELEHLKAGSEPAPTSSTDASGPSLITAVQEQLGLKLEPHIEPVPVLVIDHAELPSEI